MHKIPLTVDTRLAHAAGRRQTNCKNNDDDEWRSVTFLKHESLQNCREQQLICIVCVSIFRLPEYYCENCSTAVHPDKVRRAFVTVLVAPVYATFMITTNICETQHILRLQNFQS